MKILNTEYEIHKHLNNIKKTLSFDSFLKEKLKQFTDINETKIYEFNEKLSDVNREKLQNILACLFDTIMGSKSDKYYISHDEKSLILKQDVIRDLKNDLDFNIYDD